MAKQELALWTPSTSLSIEQQAAQSKEILRWSTSPQSALEQAKKLVAAWPHANPPNALGYAASLGAVLEQYPLGLVQECCDPRTGLAREREFPPTPASIIDWCDKRLKFHRGAVKWGELKAREAAETVRFSEEHERGMLERMRSLMHGLFKQQQQAEAAE